MNGINATNGLTVTPFGNHEAGKVCLYPPLAIDTRRCPPKPSQGLQAEVTLVGCRPSQWTLLGR